jgi:hypothetical protein
LDRKLKEEAIEGINYIFSTINVGEHVTTRRTEKNHNYNRLARERVFHN